MDDEIIKTVCITYCTKAIEREFEYATSVFVILLHYKGIHMIPL